MNVLQDILIMVKLIVDLAKINVILVKELLIIVLYVNLILIEKVLLYVIVQKDGLILWTEQLFVKLVKEIAEHVKELQPLVLHALMKLPDYYQLVFAKKDSMKSIKPNVKHAIFTAELV